MGQRIAAAALLLTLVAVAACAQSFSLPGRVGATPVTTAAPTTVAAAFDLAAARRRFTDECNDPIVVDDHFCEQVRINDMAGEGTILKVPTTLNAAAKDRAGAICEQVAVAHHDGTGKNLGYETVGVLDKDGGFMASCSLD